MPLLVITGVITNAVLPPPQPVRIEISAASTAPDMGYRIELRRLCLQEESNFQRLSSAPTKDHAQSTGKKAPTGSRVAGFSDQPGDSKADFFSHLYGLTFMMKFVRVITLGRFQSGAEKDQSVVSEMMRHHFKQGTRILQDVRPTSQR